MGMIFRASVVATALVLVSASGADAQPSFQGQWAGPDFSDVHAQSPCPNWPAYDDFDYNRKKGGVVSVFRNRKAERPPVVIRLVSYHGITDVDRYSTECLIPFLHDQGFAIASIGHWRPRKVPGAEFASEMAGAVGQIVRRADEYGFDPSRIILHGDDWSGHFAALLGTDPSYLTAAGVDFSALRAVLIFEGSGFDIPARIASASAYRRKQLLPLGGSTVETQRRMSPVAHLSPPNAPRFLFHAVRTHADGVMQAEQFAAALRAAGTSAEVRQVSPNSRKFVSTYIGSDQHSENDELLRFLREAVRP